MGSDKEQSLQRNVDMRDELLARKLNDAVRTKKREDQVRRKMHHHHTRVAKYNEDDGGIFDNLF
jgi:hypothetical protein